MSGPCSVHPLEGPTLADVLNDVAAERQRQEAIAAVKRAKGIDWRSCADPNMAGGDDRRFAVLGEEVGEVARAVLEATFVPTDTTSVAYQVRESGSEYGDARLREELIQVAAVAVAWVEAIDARAGR